ncbi:MAG: M3 family metallopeptidase [Betaproteobacteria bacterium]|nr:M3 family metallopeptidase [Betaproteobacteria bacterium]
MNPLLDFSGLPRFGDIEPRHVAPAIDSLLAQNRALLADLTSGAEQPTWETFAAPLEEANDALSRAWSQVSHLNAVMNSPSLREAYNATLPKITQYYAAWSQDIGLYERFKSLRESPGFAKASLARRRIVDNELRDFRLGGAHLPPAQKGRFLAIQEELASLSARFEENVLDATNAFALYLATPDALAGLPADLLAAARESAKEDGREGFKLTLHAPSYVPVMQYAHDRALRETLYHAFVTRASEFGQAAFDNTALISSILRLRQEAAHLLDFRNYAEVSLASKMAESPAHVLAFLDDLGERAKPSAERDFEELAEFARAELGLARVEAWDIAYASEKLRLARYAFSEQEVKQYLPEPHVLSGLFALVKRLYGLTIRRTDARVWHPDVRFFEIRDRDETLIGQFYLDLYARAHKRGGAWMDDAMTRRRKVSGMQTPVAYLTCNFSRPVGDKPALFTHDEVLTLFHEFGHGLHHLLTRMEERGVSGIHGVEWDAVELPSQFMENFCWEWDVLRELTSHAETGERLPRTLFDKMTAAKNFQSGMQTVRQIEFALFDMHLHTDFDPNGPSSVLDVLEAVRARIAVVMPPQYNRFPNSFSHIFAGGYAAGYYSYKWAEVLSADAFSLFEENGVLSEEIGQRFWREILAMGGARPAMESFVAFRGRKPTLDALLRHSGLHQP